MEGEVIITQDLFVYEILGEDANGKLIGRHRSTGIGRPRFWERARYLRRRQAARRRARCRRSRRANRTRAEGTPMPMQIACHVRTGRARGRRRDLGVRLSDPVGRATGREAPGERHARRADRARRRRGGARQPKGSTRAGRGHAEGARSSGRRRRRTCRSPMRISQAGLSGRSASSSSSASRSARRCSSSSSSFGGGLLIAAGARLRGRVRRAALAARVPEEAAREQVPAIISPTRST